MNDSTAMIPGEKGNVWFDHERSLWLAQEYIGGSHHWLTGGGPHSHLRNVPKLVHKSDAYSQMVALSDSFTFGIVAPSLFSGKFLNYWTQFLYLEEPPDLGDAELHDPDVEEHGDKEVEEVDDREHFKHEHELHRSALVHLCHWHIVDIHKKTA